jgi:hypothetical protein
MKLNALFLSVTIVTSLMLSPVWGGQTGHSRKHGSALRASIGHHAKKHYSHHTRSTPVRRITSGIYVPPRRSHSKVFSHHGYRGNYQSSCYPNYDYGYGYDSGYTYGNQERRFYPYISGDIPPVTEVERVTVHNNRDVILDTTVNAATQHRLIGKILRDITSQRIDAARQLTRYPNIASVAVLIDALVNDASEQVRKAAAKSLGEIYDPAAYLALLRSERYDPYPLVRNAAEHAIEETRYNNSLEVYSENPVMIAMNDGRAKLGDYLEKLRFGRADQRQGAIRQLDRYQGTQVVAAMINALINDPDLYVRKEAAYRLGKAADPMALPFLEDAASNDLEKIVRRNAKKALGAIRP